MKNTENALVFLELSKNGINDSADKKRYDRVSKKLRSNGIDISSPSTMREQAYILDNLSFIENFCELAEQVQKDKRHVRTSATKKRYSEFVRMSRRLKEEGVSTDPKHLRNIVTMVQGNKKRYARMQNRNKESLKTQRKAKIDKIKSDVDSYVDEAIGLELNKEHLVNAYVDCRLRQAASV